MSKWQEKCKPIQLVAMHSKKEKKQVMQRQNPTPKSKPKKKSKEKKVANHAVSMRFMVFGLPYSFGAMNLNPSQLHCNYFLQPLKMYVQLKALTSLKR